MSDIAYIDNPLDDPNGPVNEAVRRLNASGLLSAPIGFINDPFTDWNAAANRIVKEINAAGGINGQLLYINQPYRTPNAAANDVLAMVNALGPQAGGYTTGAVSFDGTTTFMALASLTATDNATASTSFWFQFPNGAFANNGSPIFDTDIAAADNNLANFHGTNDLGIDYANHAGTTFSIWNDGGSATIVDKSWHHFLHSIDFTGSGTQAAYLDGVLITPGTSTFTNPPGTINANGLSYNLVGDGTGFPWDVMNIADYWHALGQSLLLGSTVPAGTIAKFISGGKPVNLGANGQTPTGTRPAIFLRRAPGVAASTFATNLGTGGGPFTITGTLTNAPTSPSD